MPWLAVLFLLAASSFGSGLLPAVVSYYWQCFGSGILPAVFQPRSQAFSRLGVGSTNACRLTMRAPDKWDSSRFTAWLWDWMGWASCKLAGLQERGVGIFLASSFYYTSNMIHARPLAGNANRSAASPSN